MRYGFIAAVLAAVSLPVSATLRAAEAPRIGVVDLQQVIVKSERGQEANQKLQGIAKGLESAINDRRQKVLVIKEQLDKADSKSADYQKLLKNYQNSLNDFQQFVAMNRQDLEARRQELVTPIEQELGRVLNQYAQAHHYDIVLSKNAAGAVYTNGKYDITQGVIAAMDKDWARVQKEEKNKNQQSPKGDAPAGGGHGSQRP